MERNSNVEVLWTRWERCVKKVEFMREKFCFDIFFR